eukprot:TRINITY_DN710_c0_g1_i3.p1 TRINITY_DN710_c0_g1~~TRINITY_DN710_c0_g1_i3.p1  ORF type:complete len:200 (+),score=59.78 TRINITY_DN710_c0_g1_i3:192-791(+)
MREQFNAADAMQTFVDHNENSPSSNTLLPYHFDDECHLVLNDNFYTHSPLYETKEMDPFDSTEMELDLINPFAETDPTAESPEVETSEAKLPVPETESEVSTEASGPFVTSAPFPIPMQSIHTLDAQLDFIMETTKKHQKPREKSHKRNRKTPQQLKTLIDELGSVQNADKMQIKTVAAKAGLTELQVYKWYWDRKAKN